MNSRILTPTESRRWQQKLTDDVSAKPLDFAVADDANAPFQVSVTNGQAPGGGKTLVIQLMLRPDVRRERAVEVAQHALSDVFGREAGAEADLDYMDAAELKKRTGVDGKFVTNVDSLSIVFGPGRVSATRRPPWVRDQLAAALRRWWETSAGW